MFTIRKIHFTLICFTIICTTIQAQTNRNTWMAGGNFDLIAGLGDARPISQFQLQTNVGYFPLKGLSIGATTLIQRIKYTTNGTTISTGFGPFLRYYISTPTKIISPYISAEYIFSSTRDNFEGDVFNEAKSRLLRPGLGLAVFITPNIALENQVTYQYVRVPDNSLLNQSFVQFSMGLQVHLYRKKEK